MVYLRYTPEQYQNMEQDVSMMLMETELHCSRILKHIIDQDLIAKYEKLHEKLLDAIGTMSEIEVSHN